MQVGIKDGGDGVRCWNAAAVRGYADEVNRREQQVTQNNPDVAVLPGKLVCYGCEVMEYDYGVKCTATLTRTRYAVQGEIEPRPEDAKGSLLDIPGFQGRAPADIEAEAKVATAVAAPANGSHTPPAPAPAPADTRRSGLRGLFNR
jgi:hypothetical protein